MTVLKKMKKQIEEKTSFKGAQAADIKGRENELNHHLELITNIASRIEKENRMLMKKNKELKNDYRAQENDRKLLLTQLVLLKKENAATQEEIDYYSRVIEKEDDQKEEGGANKLSKNGLRSSSTLKAAHTTMDAKKRLDMKQESEQEKIARYERIIEKLRRTLDGERKNLKLTRTDYQMEIASKTDLEKIMKECVEAVKQEVRERHRERAG